MLRRVLTIGLALGLGAGGGLAADPPTPAGAGARVKAPFEQGRIAPARGPFAAAAEAEPAINEGARWRQTPSRARAMAPRMGVEVPSPAWERTRRTLHGFSPRSPRPERALAPDEFAHRRAVERCPPRRIPGLRASAAANPDPASVHGHAFGEVLQTPSKVEGGGACPGACPGGCRGGCDPQEKNDTPTWCPGRGDQGTTPAGASENGTTDGCPAGGR